MNNKKLIRLTESDLHRIVRESMNTVLNENQEQFNFINNRIDSLNNISSNLVSYYQQLIEIYKGITSFINKEAASGNKKLLNQSYQVFDGISATCNGIKGMNTLIYNNIMALTNTYNQQRLGSQQQTMQTQYPQQGQGMQQ